MSLTTFHSRSVNSCLSATLALSLLACDGTPAAPLTVTEPVSSSAASLRQGPSHDVLTFREGAGIIRDTGSPLWTALGQSPIDLSTSRTTRLLSGDPHIAWTPFAPSVSDEHELKVSTGDAGGHVTIRGKQYRLKQFHFHRESEHAINGRRSAMEVHFVHMAADGALAVIGVLLEVGRENAALEAIWPSAAEHGVRAARFNPSALLPASSAPYFTYSGSLTTPGFGEGLTWIVYQQPIQLSAVQLRRYAAAYPHTNARELQPLDGRTVFQRVGGGR
jgi:carbonic anhydrase